jgi:hypothetical protein
MAGVIHMYRDEETGVIARWHGGEYVELYADGENIAHIFTGEAAGYDAINVWDYEAGAPRILPDELGSTVREHLDYAGETD